MSRGLPQLLLIAALLGCPYVCRAGACSAVCGTASESHEPRCCDACDADQERSDESQPIVPGCPDDCPIACLCKGAVQVDGWELDFAPAVLATFTDASPPVFADRWDVPVPTAPPPLGDSGRAIRLAVASLLC